MRNGETLVIGEQPRLIVNLKDQKNYIEVNGRRIPYKREVAFSKDLLEGKRKAVFDTAINHYYRQACQVADGYWVAERYIPKING